MATAEAGPASERGSVGVRATGAETASTPGLGLAARCRFIHPSSVALRPGVPLSMKSCASKCDRVGSGLPTGVHDGEAALLPERLQSGEGGMEGKPPVERDRLLSRGTAIDGRSE